ncbi:MAG TPA: toprim domain-containing protein [Pedomonas sp.]|uniref:DUF7146 domain-containing protein n=1 Tax=Pedomonas sp. TaxID=2976421 RepID=UPI002F3E5DA1
MTSELAAAGARLCGLLGGAWFGQHGMCRCPAHKDRTPSLSIRTGEQALLFKCHAGCSQSSVLAAIRRYEPHLGGCRLKALPPERSPQEIQAWVERLWQEAVPVQNTLAARYLEARGLTAPQSVPLRFLPRCRHRPSGHRPPVLLAACQDLDGRLVALHRIYLDPNEPRLSSCEPRRMLTNAPGKSAVQLAPARPTLGLAEGVETALAAMQLHGIPVWAALSSTRLYQLALPECVQTLVLFGDNDEAGRHGVARAQATYARAGLEVLARFPEPPFNDWADVLKPA